MWKALKVFVSSTFKDLELERDRLAQVFQSIKEEIFARQLSLISYDLRWRDRHEDQDVVRWCLEMIEQCQYFVNILGYRYGWRPLVDRHGNSNDRHISITEMEIDRALELLPQERRFFCVGNLSQYSREEIEKESKEDIASIEALKDRLRHKGQRVLEYNNFDELLGIIYRELKNSIDGDFPPGMVVPLEIHSDQQALDEIIEDKLRGFVGREKYLQELSKFVGTKERPNYLVISSLAGNGKSALLARFIRMWQKSHQDIPVIAHYMSMKEDSRNVDSIMRNLARQLKELQFLEKESDGDPATLRDAVRNALERTDKSVILAIDGLDEIAESGQNLLWLSRIFPANVRVILTTRPAVLLETLSSYPYVRHVELAPLGNSEINEIIGAYNENHNLKLLPLDQEQLVKRASGNPLFLKVALDEILSSGIAVGQLATTIEALFHQILERLERIYGKEIICDYLGLIAAAQNGISEHELQELLTPPIPGSLTKKFSDKVEQTLANAFRSVEDLQQQYGLELVADYLGFLCASHAGVSEDELRNLLASDKKDRVNDEFLLRVRKALENFVIQRGGLYSFFHIEFERSIKMWLGKAGMRNYHRRFADYLQDKGYQYSRTLSELPYQEQWGERFESLLKLLTDIEFLQAKCKAGMENEICQDLQRALSDKVVPLPKGLRIEVAPGIGVTRETIRLMERALTLDMQFLARHPDSLFQCLWNRCYWHDCPEVQRHCAIPAESTAVFQGLQAGDPIYHLAEKWRKDKETDASFVYIKSRRPLSPNLNSALLKTLRGHAKEVNVARFSPDGTLLASAGKDHTVRVWDAASGTCLYTLQGHEKNVASVAFSPDGTKIVSASSDNTIRIWDVKNGEVLRVLQGHESPINCAIFNNDGKKVIFGSEDSTVRIWNLEEANPQILVGHRAAVTCVALSPDGLHIASGSEDNTVQIWNMSMGTCSHSLHGHEHWIRDIAFSPNGQQLASASEDKSMRIWDVKTGTCVATVAEHQKEILCLAFHPAGTHIAVGSSDKDIRIWDVMSSKYIRTLPGHEKSVYSVAYSKEGNHIVSASSDQTLRIWDTTSRWELPQVQSHEDRIPSLSRSPNGAYLASTSYDGTVRIWDVNTGSCLHVCRGHKDIVMCANFSPDSLLMASGGLDNTIRLWDVKTGKCIKILEGHMHAVLDIAFSPDNTRLISASYDRTLRYWDIASGTSLQVFMGHRRDIGCVDIDRDGTKIASGAADNMVKIWDTSGKCLYTLLGHTRKVLQVCFSSDNTRVISYSEDNTSRIWDLATGQCTQVIQGTYSDKARNWQVSCDDLELRVSKKDKDAHVYFPEAIRDAMICQDNFIYGSNRTGYVYIMELKEPQKSDTH